MVLDIFLPDTVYYLTILGMVQNYDHSRCSDNICGRESVDNGLYETEHTHKNCTCSMVHIDLEEIVNILADGGVPVVEVQLSDMGVNVRVSTDVSYTAISHVWSHGLGNHNDNALPDCQLRRICEAVRDLPDNNASIDTVYIWLDTLCVPVRHSLRSTAIVRMRQTYQDAASVLVLDKSLYRNRAPSTPAETLVRVVCADWFSRLWTLQEAILAETLWVQFSDRALNLIEAHRSDPGPESLVSNVWADAFQHFSDVALMQKKIWRETSGVNHLVTIIRALRYRTTSWRQDEALCMSILLDLDVDLIVKTPAENRMQTFLSQLYAVPPEILFLSGPKLTAPGFCWAPASFLSRSSSSDTYDLGSWKTVRRTAEGIEVVFPGFLIQYPGTKLQSTFTFLDEIEQIWYLFESASDVFPADAGTRPWGELESLPAPALIVHQTLAEDAGNSNTIVCALISNTRNENGVIYGNFESRAFVTRLAETSELAEKIDMMMAPENINSGLMARGRLLPTTQRWCVG